MTHDGPLCPCPICKQRGHLYYNCPDRDKKESIEGAYEQMKLPEDGPLCGTCGQKHEPPCTIGLRQQSQIQEQIRQKREAGEHRELVNELRSGLKNTTPFCMYCGGKGGQHTPNCELLENMGPSGEPVCTFCGIVGHWADNCAEHQRAFQEQQQSGHLCMFCGSQDHVYLNCVLYRENLKNQKYNINSQNEAKYRTAAVGQRNTMQQQQNKDHTHKREGGRASTHSATTTTTLPKRATSIGGGGINLQENQITLKRSPIQRWLTILKKKRRRIQIKPRQYRCPPLTLII